MLHLCTTSSHHLVAMIACFVASPMFHSYLLSWLDDIYVHASHMIYFVHCRLPPIVASMTVETWTSYLWCMLVWLRLLYLVVLAPYASILWNAPLSFLMMSMMHTLVGYLTTRMIGFALPLTSFVFSSVCHVLSFWRIHKVVPPQDNLVMWRHTRCATPTFARIS